MDRDTHMHTYIHTIYTCTIISSESWEVSNQRAAWFILRISKASSLQGPTTLNPSMVSEYHLSDIPPKSIKKRVYIVNYLVSTMFTYWSLIILSCCWICPFCHGNIPDSFRSHPRGCCKVKKAMENWTEPAPKEKTKKRKTNKDEEKKEVAIWLNKIH